jgi:glycosyltransferase involved in cell wall biosynthesis
MLRPHIGGLKQYFRNLFEWLLANDRQNEYLFFYFRHNVDELQKLRSDRWRSNAMLLEDQSQILDHLGKIDVYFCPFGPLWPRPVPLPTVMTLSDIQEVFYPEFFTPAELLIRADHFRGSAAMADRVITVSEFSRQSIIRHYGVPGHRVVVAYHCPNLPAFQTGGVAESWDAPLPPSDWLFYPANHWRHKNHETLLQALVLLREQGLEIPLVVTGYDMPNGYPLKKRVAELGLGSQVWDVGYVSPEQLSFLYDKSRLVVVPSLFEGFGLPLVEAMAAGRAVVASRTSSLPEIGGGAVAYFDPLVPADMAGVVREYWLNARERRNLVERGRQRVRFFSPQRMAASHLEAFEQAFRSFSWRRYIWQAVVSQRLHALRLRPLRRTAQHSLASLDGAADVTFRFAAGWYPPNLIEEKAVYWNSGHGRIELTASRAGVAELSATLYTIRQPNEIEILLNGRPLHVCLFSGSGFGSTDIEGLPVELHEGLNRLDIHSQMSSLVPASDTRKLAVAVTSLRLASGPSEARADGKRAC